jgi:hypothetical protein
LASEPPLTPSTRLTLPSAVVLSQALPGWAWARPAETSRPSANPAAASVTVAATPTASRTLEPFGFAAPSWAAPKPVPETPSASGSCRTLRHTLGPHNEGGGLSAL